MKQTRPYRRMIRETQDVVELPDWVIRSRNIPDGYRYSTFGGFIWEDGIWKNGTWEKGVWEDGIWRNGIWEDGVWEKGIWKGGTWKEGTWKGGIWKGGTWEDGIWERGTWSSGVWKGGVWESGVWENGVWKYGSWEGGTWEGGTWEYGWIYDPLKKGNYAEHWKWNGDYVKSPLDPREYFGKDTIDKRITESNHIYKSLFFQEAIPLSKVRPFIRGESSKYKDRLKDWFDGKWRVVVDLKKEVGKKVKSDLGKDIERALSNTDFEVKDFEKGIAYDKKNDRDIKLGKVLNKIGDEELLQRFSNAAERQGSKAENLKMVISRHPYDILGQSYDRGWTSCKELGKGSKEKYLYDEIFQTIIAYLVYPDDLNIKRPIARILAVPYFNNQFQIGYVIQQEVYGSAGSWESAFRKAFQDWLDSKQGKLKGNYKISPFVYNDKLPTEIRFFSDDLPKWVIYSKNIPEEFTYDRDNVFIWKKGIWQKGVWETGFWKDGLWKKGVWKYGVWENGTWKNGIWVDGRIYDPDKEGNFEKHWEWDGDFVRSPINPKEYFLRS